MKQAVLWTTLTGLALASGYLGYRLYHYLQERPAHSPTAIVDSGRQVAIGAQVIGRNRPEFTLPDLDGRPRAITEWDGKVLALNFWATWCPPCLKEVPEFVALQEKYRAQGLQFIGIALQKPEEVREFVAQHKVNYPILAGELEVVELAQLYGNNLGALPYTVIIDRNGLITHVKAGVLPTEEAENIIRELL